MIGPYIQVTGAISKCFTFPWRISRTCTATPVAVHILMCICTRYLHFQYNYVPLTTCCVFPAKKHFCNTQKRTFFSTLNKLKYEIVLLQTSLGESYCYFNELQSCQQTIYSRGAVAALCTISTILLTFLGKSCNAHMLHASGVYYSYRIDAYKRPLLIRAPL